MNRLGVVLSSLLLLLVVSNGQACEWPDCPGDQPQPWESEPEYEPLLEPTDLCEQIHGGLCYYEALNPHCQASQKIFGYEGGLPIVDKNQQPGLRASRDRCDKVALKKGIK